MIYSLKNFKKKNINEINNINNLTFKRPNFINKKDKELEKGDFLSLTNLSSEDKSDFNQSEKKFQCQVGNEIENVQNENKKSTIAEIQ